MAWILLVLLYGLLKGGREIIKKLAMTKNTVMDVLIAYTILSFVFVIPQARFAGGLEGKYYGFIAIKAFAIFIAWICGFQSLKKLPVGIYGLLDLTRVLFATFFGVVLLRERMNAFQLAGLFIVCGGLVLLRFKPPFLKKLFHVTEDNLLVEETAPSSENKPEQQSTEQLKAGNPEQQTKASNRKATLYIVLALISCILNAFSGFLDKVLMKDITSAQLQFWYMLFITCYYLLYLLVTRTKMQLTVWKNPWVWVMAVMFVISDKALFIANGMEQSKITIMTLIKQAGCLVTILGGCFVFKEKNTAYRLFCAFVIIAGIMLGVLSKV